VKSGRWGSGLGGLRSIHVKSPDDRRGLCVQQGMLKSVYLIRRLGLRLLG